MTDFLNHAMSCLFCSRLDSGATKCQLGQRLSDDHRTTAELLAEPNIFAQYTKCEEAAPLSATKYIPCGGPVHALVKTRDPIPYFMCNFCAWHNEKNRGAVILLAKGV